MKSLYKKRTDGKLQVWSIEVLDDKFRVTSGIVDGKLVVNNWTTVIGKNIGKKNETSPEDQAIKEAQAKHKKHTEEGYTEDKTAVDTAAIFRPMLANDYNKYKDKIVFPVYDNPKYDGIRCIATKKGLRSRNGKEFVAIPHIHKALEEVFKGFPDLIIDGELYADKYSENFNKICSLVKRSNPSPEDMDLAKEIKYHVYDCYDGSDTKYSARKKFIDRLLRSLPEVMLCKETKVNNHEELDVLYEKHMEEGYEGQIIRLDKAYDNKRTNSLLKRKEFKTEEYRILDIVEGIGNRAGTAGYAELRTEREIDFKSNFKGDFEFLTEVLENKDNYIGKLATVKYFNKTPGRDIPRFPYIIAIRDYE